MMHQAPLMAKARGLPVSTEQPRLVRTAVQGENTGDA